MKKGKEWQGYSILCLGIPLIWVSQCSLCFTGLEEWRDLTCQCSLIASHGLSLTCWRIKGAQDWLLLSCKQWELFTEYRKIEEFATNLEICNDFAERGVQFITNLIDKTQNEDQIQALLQVVEHHRNLVLTSNLKKS